MHELSITEEILESVLQEAEQAQAGRVTTVYLVNGPLSGIEDEAVRFYWDAIAGKTICAGAELHFDRESAEIMCLDCEQSFLATEADLLCPACGGGRLQFLTGNRLRLEAIDVE